jgi:hypothetical protein
MSGYHNWRERNRCVTQTRARTDVVGPCCRSHQPWVLSAERWVALGVAPEAQRAGAARVLTHWRVVREHIADVWARLTERQMVPAADGLLSVPQVSVVCAATLAELGDPCSYLAPRQVWKLAASISRAVRAARASVGGSSKRSAGGRCSAGSSSSLRAAGVPARGSTARSISR